VTIQNQIPVESLPDGTILKTTAYWNGLPFTHYGIVQRAWNGQVLIHHNSKKIGHAATTGFFEFSGGQLVFLDHVPQTLSEGWKIAERARGDVERGVVWTVTDNCEDMKSRALTGRPGSPTRDAFVGLSALGIILFLALRA
jgi:hypothetical protein